MKDRHYFFEKGEFSFDYSLISDNELEYLIIWLDRCKKEFPDLPEFEMFFEKLQDQILSEAIIRQAGGGKRIETLDLKCFLLAFDLAGIIALRRAFFRIWEAGNTRRFFGQAMLQHLNEVIENDINEPDKTDPSL